MNGLIIPSLLDNDLYSFSQQNAIIKLFPNAIVRYQFVNRGKTSFPKGFAKVLEQQVFNMQALTLQENDIIFLQIACPYLDRSYIDFLRGYRFNPKEVCISQEGGELFVSVEGPWYRVVLWEVSLLALISELYFILTEQKPVYSREERLDRNKKKMDIFSSREGLTFSEFGTRRRYSLENHREVLKDFISCNKRSMVGTSNVMLARELNLKPIGTMAHQFIQGVSVLCSINRANHYAMEKWMEVYDNSLGTILTDTFGMDAFLKDFNGKFLNLFQSVRQDSGSPFVFVDKIIGHYKKFGINPLEKTIIFSDSLNPEKAVEIFDYCKGKIKCSFGIGTNLTADVGMKPLNMVIKLWEVNGTKVAKLSDEPGKETGDPEAIKLYKAIYGR